MAEAPTTKPATGKDAAADDEIMAIRKQAGSIAEVIEPVTRTQAERTN